MELQNSYNSSDGYKNHTMLQTIFSISQHRINDYRNRHARYAKQWKRSFRNEFVLSVEQSFQS